MRLALCVPAYNAAPFLPRLLRSAAAQTEPFDEVWVYDDASTDSTGEVAVSHGARVVRGRVNVGCSQGKHILAQSTGCEWIHFHDADDDLMPDFVARAHRRMADPSAPDVVLFDYVVHDFETGRILANRRFDPTALARDPLSYAITEQINPYCGLYRREAYFRAGGYDTDPEVLFNEDCAFHIRLALAGLTFGVECGPAIINLERPGSMSSANRVACALARLAVLRKTASAAPPSHRLSIADELWLNARILASLRQGRAAAAATRLAQRLGRLSPPRERLPVRLLSRFAPATTFQCRAALVRWRNRMRASAQ